MHLRTIRVLVLVLGCVACGAQPTPESGGSQSAQPDILAGKTSGVLPVPSTVAVPTAVAAVVPPPEEIQVLGGSVLVQFSPASTARRAPDRPGRDASKDDAVGDQILAIQSWDVGTCTPQRCDGIVLLVERDQGPNAAIFGYKAIDTFKTSFADWTVISLGDDSFLSAFARGSGVMVHVTGQGASLDAIKQFASTIVVRGK